MAMVAGARTEVIDASTLSVDVQIACDVAGVPDADAIRDWVRLATEGADSSSDGATEITVRVVDADEIHALNSLYRHKDKPTNVLSFPAGHIDGLPEGEPRLLGDVVVCASIVAAEAREQGKEVDQHWGHMLIHGTLHLLGFDHEAEDDAAAMERLEADILGKRGIADPYASS